LESESLFDLITTKSWIKFISIHLTIGSLAVEFFTEKSSGITGILNNGEVDAGETAARNSKFNEKCF